MPDLKLLKQELKLRRLFTEYIKKRGYQPEVHSCSLATLFEKRQETPARKIRQLWINHLAHAHPQDDRTFLYLHIPYCRQECHYCAYRKLIYSGTSQMDHYLRYLAKEIRSYKDIFQNFKFKCLYIGGGSPSILTEKQLKCLFKEINGAFAFDERAQKTFEVNPRDFTPAKMKILADFGINRISFGVQSFDPHVLRHANRGYQRYAMIRNAVRLIRTVPAFEVIDGDLLIGLRKDTPQTVLKSFIKLAELQFDSIAVFPVKPTMFYLKKGFNNDRMFFDRQLADKFRSFEKLVMPVARKFGYAFDPLNCSFPDKFTWDFALRKNLPAAHRRIGYITEEAPFSCLGLGRGTWSTIANTVWYLNQGFLSTLREKDYGQNKFTAIFLDAQHERFWYAYRRLGYMRRISIALYKQWFGTDVREDFKELLAKLKKLKAVIVTDEIVLMPEMTPEERFAYILFFVTDQEIFDAMETLSARSASLERFSRGHITI